MSGWRDYLSLEGFTPREQALVERSLDDIWATPEGRDLIERAPSHSGAQVSIHNTTRGDGDHSSDANIDYIGLNFTSIAHQQFATQSGGYRHTSVTETLVHELFHTTDNRIEALNRNGSLFNSFITATPEGRAIPPEVHHAIGERIIQFAGEGILPLLEDYQELGDMTRLDYTTDLVMDLQGEYFVQLTKSINRVGEDRGWLTTLAQEYGLESLSVGPVDASSALTAFRAHLVAREESRNLRRSMEELATDYTDYFMLRYYGIEPREDYMTDIWSEIATNYNVLPRKSAQPLQTAAVLKEAGEYVLGGGGEVHNGSLGVLDVPPLPHNITSQIERQ